MRPRRLKYSLTSDMKFNRRPSLGTCRAALALLVFVIAGFPGQTTAQSRVHITILGTTDLHGNIYPVDYYTNKPDNRGLAKVATLIKRARKENQNLVLVDSGDTIQGTPLAYYHNKKNNKPPNPMMLVMNSLSYDVMAVGNHEYNFGLRVLGKGSERSSISLVIRKYLRKRK